MAPPALPAVSAVTNAMTPTAVPLLLALLLLLLLRCDCSCMSELLIMPYTSAGSPGSVMDVKASMACGLIATGQLPRPTNPAEPCCGSGPEPCWGSVARAPAAWVCIRMSGEGARLSLCSNTSEGATESINDTAEFDRGPKLDCEAALLAPACAASRASRAAVCAAAAFLTAATGSRHSCSSRGQRW